MQVEELTSSRAWFVMALALEYGLGDDQPIC
jgi:hypothetical protein